jgi:hypothetical protein
MQKVEGSNPFGRFRESHGPAGFFAVGVVARPLLGDLAALRVVADFAEVDHHAGLWS